MRAVIAAQSWPSDTAGRTFPVQTARLVQDTWSATASHVDLAVVATPDGGPRSADALPGITGALDGATVLQSDDAVVLAPIAGARWEPGALASALDALARAGEKRKVMVPLGDEPPAGDAADLWTGSLEAARDSVATLDLVALVASERPLLGFHGMSAAVRDGREHDAALARAAQAQEDRWTAIARATDPIASRRTLIGPARLSDEPGTGAAGGLAYVLAAMGARLVPAATAIAELSSLTARAADADLIVVVTERVAARDLDHGAPLAASSLAAARGVPCVLVAAEVAVGRRDLMAAGIAAAHEGRRGEAGLADQIRRVAQTWTPRP